MFVVLLISFISTHYLYSVMAGHDTVLSPENRITCAQKYHAKRILWNLKKDQEYSVYASYLYEILESASTAHYPIELAFQNYNTANNKMLQKSINMAKDIIIGRVYLHLENNPYLYLENNPVPVFSERVYWGVDNNPRERPACSLESYRLTRQIMPCVEDKLLMQKTVLTFAETEERHLSVIASLYIGEIPVFGGVICHRPFFEYFEKSGSVPEYEFVDLEKYRSSREEIL
ncbi:MAG: hypothetical protein OXC30_05590 [Alphaproteobacteria bacterium]|nr:hypothetical protein [Alphaproteobacteria bacterium]